MECPIRSGYLSGLGLGQLFFLAIQYIAQAGWSMGLLRVMEAQAFTIVIPLIVIADCVPWFGPCSPHVPLDGRRINIEGHENYDKIIAGKRGFLNPIFFIIRVLIYIGGWVWAALMLGGTLYHLTMGTGQRCGRNRRVAISRYSMQ